MNPRWVPKAAVLAIHEMLLSEHGGSPGLLHEGALDSALASPQNQLAYSSPDLFDLAAHYASSLTRNHPFRDGNKRVAFTVAAVFLEMNGFRIEAPEIEVVQMVVTLSSRELDERRFARWLQSHSTSIRRRRKPATSHRPRSPRKRSR